MLRQTDRLHRLCQACDYRVMDNSDDWSKVTEVEFVHEESLHVTTEQDVPTFPPDFRWDAFCACWAPRSEELIVLLSTRPPEIMERWVPIPDVNTTDNLCHEPRALVLWVSNTTFLSLIEFRLCTNFFFGGRPLFEYRVSFSPGMGDYYAYSVSRFTVTTLEDGMAATSSEIPLRFLHHVTAGLPTGFFSHLELTPGEPDFPPRLCSQFLSIIRPDESNDECVPCTTVRFFTGLRAGYDEDQLVAILSHHYCAQVKLVLGAFREHVPLDRVNQLLCESQTLRHLRVPENLIEFDSSDLSFTSNPHFLSLEILDISDGEISLKLLDGLALNTGLNDVTLGFSIPRDRPFHAPALDKLTHLFGHVLPKCSSLSSLTLDLYHAYPTSYPRPLYEEIVRSIASSSPARIKDRFGSLSSIKVLFSYFAYGASGRRNLLVLPPSETWDRLVSPSLLLTWCRKQRNGHSAKRLPLGLIVAAMRQINQNVAYRKTSVVKPCDSRAANASAIYDTICTFHPAFGRGLAPTAPAAVENSAY
jgi:hypothetical protein